MTGQLTTTKLSAPHSAGPRDDSAARAALLVYHREGAELVPLEPGVSIVVGRLPPSDVIVADVSLSRQHARFTLEDGQLAVKDLGSSNGCLLRGEAIDEARLRPGDEVSLGLVVVAFHLTAGAARLGLVGYDRLCELIEADLERAAFFTRKLSVMMVEAARGAGENAPHYGAFYGRVLSALRRVDRLGVYSSSTLIALLPELGAESAVEVAQKLVTPDAGPLRVGVATYPTAGTSVGSLLAACRAAVQTATRAEPVQQARESGASTVAPAEQEAPAPVAESPGMRHVFETARRVARGVIPVLLLGETGSGKDVVARFLHEVSPRRGRPLVCVNCGAIAPTLLESTLFGHEKGAFTGALQQRKGVFEAAEGGTVFLDELAELPPLAQAALLRVLETKRVTRLGASKEVSVDVRVLAATNRDLEAMCRTGQFREDLLYRLNTVTIRVPPLRERPEDIPPLVERFLAQASHGGGARRIDPEALALLGVNGWPGNVRELRNAIERAVAIAPDDTIGVDDLPERVRAGALPRGGAPGWAGHAEVGNADSTNPPPGDDDGSSPRRSGSLTVAEVEGDFRTRMDQLESALLSHALEQAGHHQTETARRLAMPLRTLVHKIRVYGLKKPRKGSAT